MGMHHELRPKRGKNAVLTLLRLLSQASSWQSQHNEPDANNALARLRRVAKPGSLIFLFSDFRNLGPQAESHLAQLARHNDVVLFHIFDPLEAILPQRGLYRVAWGQHSSSFSAGPAIQNNYQQHFQQHCDNLKQLSRFPGIFYLSCATDADVLQRLQYGLGLKR